MTSWVWTRVGTLGLVAALLIFAVAWLVYSAAPRRTQNRTLALTLLMLAGIALTGGGLMYLTDDPRATYAWQAVGLMFLIAYQPMYLAFLSTLATPLARPLAMGRTVLFAAAAIGPLVWFIEPERFILGVVPTRYAPWDVLPGPWLLGLMWSGSTIALAGLVFAVSVLRRAAPGSRARSQARAYLVAFAAYDGSLLVFFGTASLAGSFSEVHLVINHVGFLSLALLLAYGMLKYQLFDLDLKLKWTLKQSTIAAIFVAVFFAVSEGAAAFFSGAIGTYAGIAAAALLVFALAPLQRFAERVSERAMPQVEATPAYAAFRKMEVYKAAVEEVLADGAVSEKDRRVLERLRAQLGLSADDARAMEEDVAEGRPV